MLHVCWLLALLTRGNGYASLKFDGAQGQSQTYSGKPAAWNAALPNFGKPKLSYSTPLDRESCNQQPLFSGRIVMERGLNASHGSRSLGCTPLPAAPQVEATAILLERGLCSFRIKAQNAFQAGHTAVIVANSVPGLSLIPDMTAGSLDLNAKVEVPGWALSKADGEALRSWMATDNSIRLTVVDDPRWRELGYWQSDSNGLREYWTS